MKLGNYINKTNVIKQAKSIRNSIDTVCVKYTGTKAKDAASKNPYFDGGLEADDTSVYIDIRIYLFDNVVGNSQLTPELIDCKFIAFTRYKSIVQNGIITYDGKEYTVIKVDKTDPIEDIIYLK